MKSNFINVYLNQTEESWDENPNNNITYILKLSDESIYIIENETGLKLFLDDIKNFNVTFFEIIK